MNKMTFAAIKYLALFFSVWVLAVSCRKGELPEEHYFGKINIYLLNLPGTPTVMMYFDGKPLDTIKVIGGSSFIVPAGGKGKLSALDAKSKEWLADTLITVRPNGMEEFRFAYSTEFGLKGFIAQGSSSTVPRDSVDVRFFNNLSASFYPKEKYDLSFIYADPVTGDIVESTAVIKGWERKKTSEVLRFIAVTPDGQPYTYAAKLIDPATGAVVLQPDGAEYFIFSGDNIGGKSQIITVGSSEDGTISPNPIDL